MYHDCHIHTWFSADGEMDPTNVIGIAKSKGLSGIYFTDHEDIGIEHGGRPFLLDIPEYFSTMTNYAKEHSDENFYIGVGIEMGLMTHIVDEVKAVLESADFDFCIGSIHCVDKQDVYYDEFYENRDLLETYKYYLDHMYDNLVAFSDFDTLGHMDYLVRYAKRFADSRGLPVPKFIDEEREERVLDFLIKHDLALEVNTASKKYGLKDPNPSFRILQKYYDMGGRMITLGSDAHQYEYIASDIPEVIEHLKRIGFNSYFIYKKRKPIEISF